MNEHFIEALDVRVLPPPDTRTFTQRLTAASREWDDVRAALQSYKSSPGAISGTALFLCLSRFIHELTPHNGLRERFLQNIETHMKTEFPPSQGKLL